MVKRCAGNWLDLGFVKDEPEYTTPRTAAAWSTLKEGSWLVYFEGWTPGMDAQNIPKLIRLKMSALSETNKSPLKMDGWNTRFLLGWPIFRAYVSFREGNNLQSSDVSSFDMANVQLHPIGVPFVAKSWANADVETKRYKIKRSGPRNKGRTES